MSTKTISKLDLAKVELFLKNSSKTIKTEEKMKRLRGESFNIFSIIRMETKEDIVHSRFIGELLNPKGTHHKGVVFLDLFLETIGFKGLPNKKIDINFCTRFIEKPIGKRNDKKKTGGRIDIYLRDGKGNSISIENKIHAPDQNTQVARYVNHNKEKNIVYYLTLWGNEPSPESKGEEKDTPEANHLLQSGIDYHCISYKDHILDWLDKCIKEAHNQPILRESIRQYILLIKKLTGQMDDSVKKELQELILTNYTSVKKIKDHERDACIFLRNEIRNEIMDALLQHKDERLHTAVFGTPVSDRFSQIYFKINGRSNDVLNIILDGFGDNPHFWGQMTLAILNPPPHNSPYSKVKGNTLKLSKWLINLRNLDKYKGFAINLRRSSTIEKLATNKEFRKGFIVDVVKQVHQYFNDEYDPLMEYLKQEKEVIYTNEKK